LIKILLDEIEYIEGLNDYIKIVTAGKKPILTLMPMKEILGKLPASRFARVHRSYIIPVDKITGYNRSHFFLGEREIPVGNTYIDCVKKILNRQ
jgi:DNA-binding LytR/AlgR family response regulator